jgi:hypothetical protein
MKSLSAELQAHLDGGTTTLSCAGGFPARME